MSQKQSWWYPLVYPFAGIARWRMRRLMAPNSLMEALFQIGMMVVVFAYLFIVPWVSEHLSPLLVFVFTFTCTSWVPMQVLGYIERGHFLVRRQYPSFLIGNSVALPSAVAMLSVLGAQAHGDYWFETGIAELVFWVVGLAVGLGFHLMDASSYSYRQWKSPTKQWHDCVAFSSLSYLMLRNIWYIWYSDWGLRSLFVDPYSVWELLLPFGVLLMIGLFVVLLTVFDHRGEKDAHVEYHWPGEFVLRFEQMERLFNQYVRA